MRVTLAAFAFVSSWRLLPQPGMSRHRQQWFVTQGLSGVLVCDGRDARLEGEGDTSRQPRAAGSTSCARDSPGGRNGAGGARSWAHQGDSLRLAGRAAAEREPRRGALRVSSLPAPAWGLSVLPRAAAGQRSVLGTPAKRESGKDKLCTKRCQTLPTRRLLLFSAKVTYGIFIHHIQFPEGAQQVCECQIVVSLRTHIAGGHTA